MKIKLAAVLPSLIILLVTVPSVSAQHRCGTSDVSKESVFSNTILLDYYQGLSANKLQLDTAPIIDVVAFLVRDTDNDNTATEEQVTAQIEVLNTAYAGRFSFNLTDVIEISSSYSDVYYGEDSEYEMKANHRQGGAATLNLYIVDVPKVNINEPPYVVPSVLGWATFPSDYSYYPELDGVSIYYDSLPGGGLSGYNEGDTGTHEVGHWLGLYHTFQGGCIKSNDGVADTPAQSGANEQCLLVDTCKRPKNKKTGRVPSYAKGKDPIYNFMNYTPDSCMYQFTEGQFSRMEAAWAYYRAGQ